MAQNTYISDVLEGNDCKDRYDTQVKKILSDKTVLPQRLTPKEKENLLSTDFDFETSAELEGGLREMCNLSDLVEERGIEQGDRLRLANLIQRKLAKGKSLEQIADELEETIEVIQPLYEQVLQEMN